MNRVAPKAVLQLLRINSAGRTADVVTGAAPRISPNGCSYFFGGVRSKLTLELPDDFTSCDKVDFSL